MEQMEKKKERIGLFEISVILFFYILPFLSITVDWLLNHKILSAVTMKWILFWGIGMRLFTCGIKQILQPAFTARNIFELKEENAYTIVRELGFSNLAVGLCGILSLFYAPYRSGVWMIGFLYYMLAFIQHVFRKDRNRTELFVTVTDGTILLELMLPIIMTAVFLK